MVLVVLKYLGLLVAASSSIWGTIHELTASGADQQKHLTHAGKVAIILTVSGLVISIISEDVERRRPTFDVRYHSAACFNRVLWYRQPVILLQRDDAHMGSRRRRSAGSVTIRPQTKIGIRHP